MISFFAVWRKGRILRNVNKRRGNFEFEGGRRDKNKLRRRKLYPDLREGKRKEVKGVVGIHIFFFDEKYLLE